MDEAVMVVEGGEVVWGGRGREVGGGHRERLGGGGVFFYTECMKSRHLVMLYL